MSPHGKNAIIGLLKEFGFGHKQKLECNGEIGSEVRSAVAELAALPDEIKLRGNRADLLINTMKILGLGPQDLVADGTIGPRAIAGLNEFLAIGQQEPVALPEPKPVE